MTRFASFAAGVTLALVALVGLAVAQERKDDPAAKDTPATAPAAKCPCAGQMTGLSKAVDEAIKAVNDGEKTVALAELSKIKDSLAKCQAHMKSGGCPMMKGGCPMMKDGCPMMKGGESSAASTKPAAACVNALCPIMGGKIDASVATRTFKGQRIGFCCGMCPPAWDKLSDKDKQAKLDALKTEDLKAKDEDSSTQPADEGSGMSIGSGGCGCCGG